MAKWLIYKWDSRFHKISVNTHWHENKFIKEGTKLQSTRLSTNRKINLVFMHEIRALTESNPYRQVNLNIQKEYLQTGSKYPVRVEKTLWFYAAWNKTIFSHTKQVFQTMTNI